jgi:AbrB family looped-hinge helix DNA binding protein
MISTLTSKGQVTLPKKFRDYLGLTAGAAVAFAFGPDGEVIVRAASVQRRTRKGQRFADLRGTLKTGKTTDQLMRLLRGYDADARDPGLK